MPSHTIASGLIKLYFEGAPWDFPAWQEITSVTHGLFPDDPAHLPKGWSVQDAINIRSYFDQYSAIATEDDKIKFAQQSKGSVLPGRTKWKSWVNSRWKTWNIQSRIIEVFQDLELHPLTLQADSSDQNKWPLATDYLLLALDPVGEALFGREALSSGGRVPRLPANLRAPVLILMQRTWSNLTRTLGRGTGRLEKCKEAALEAFKNLDLVKPKRRQVTIVMHAVARWKELAQVMNISKDLETIEGIEGSLASLMDLLAEAVRDAPKGLSKTMKDMVKSLATPDEISHLLNLYDDLFPTGGHNEDSEILCPEKQMLAGLFGHEVEGADAGVGIESGMSVADLSSALGFQDGVPFLFNRFRHKGGLSPWSDGCAKLFEAVDANSEDIEPFCLHWHQLAGVHSAIRHAFSPTPNPDGSSGVLIADEVGLGKTFQACAVIAFLAHAVKVQSRKNPLPLVIRKHPYLGDSITVPDLPHLILLPGTLSTQWVTKIKAALLPKSFDILVYGSTAPQRKQFWASDGPFYASKHGAANIIIIASHSSLASDIKLLDFERLPTVGSLPGDLPELVPSSEASLKDTLLGQRYLSVTVDEAHNFRNHGAKHSAVLRLLLCAFLRLILTATPLQTSTKDIASMGRLVGIPYFFSQSAFQEEKEDVTDLRQAKKDAIEDNYNPLDPDSVDPVVQMQVDAAVRMQMQFEDRVIRRTPDSMDNNGNLLLDLPPCVIIQACLELTERELTIIAKKEEEANENASTANGNGNYLHTKNFYIDYRKSVDYAHESPNDPLPHFDTLEEWERLKSTKMDVTARICRHLLQRDDAPEMFFEDGKAEFAPFPPLLPGEKLARTRKILIYQEFSSLSGVLLNVLDLYGVKALAIGGSIHYDQRAKIVKDFREGSEIRVLILSSVGSTGLNLSCADTIIFLDQPWSAQDESQIRGRVHRQPQKKVVHSIHPLALKTADIHLSNVALAKSNMSEAFLQGPSADTIDLLAGRAVVSDNDMPDGEQDPAKKKKTRANRKGKRRASAEPTPDSEAEDQPPAGAKMSKKVKVTRPRKPEEHGTKATGQHKAPKNAKKVVKSAPDVVHDDDDDAMVIDKADPVLAMHVDQYGSSDAEMPHADTSVGGGSSLGGVTEGMGTEDGNSSMPSDLSGAISDTSMNSKTSAEGHQTFGSPIHLPVTPPRPRESRAPNTYYLKDDTMQPESPLGIEDPLESLFTPPPPKGRARRFSTESFEADAVPRHPRIEPMARLEITHPLPIPTQRSPTSAHPAPTHQVPASTQSALAPTHSARASVYQVAMSMRPARALDSGSVRQNPASTHPALAPSTMHPASASTHPPVSFAPQPKPTAPKVNLARPTLSVHTGHSVRPENRISLTLGDLAGYSSSPAAPNPPASHTAPPNIAQTTAAGGSGRLHLSAAISIGATTNATSSSLKIRPEKLHKPSTRPNHRQPSDFDDTPLSPPPRQAKSNISHISKKRDGKR